MTGISSRFKFIVEFYECKDKTNMFTLNVNGKLLSLERPLVMGILNMTPDSFYAGSRFEATGDLLARARRMILEGADILDIGGQSSRPGAGDIGADEELRRVVGPIALLREHFPATPLSVDTYRAVVARAAVAAGAAMVNDIGAGRLDADMLATVSDLGVPYVCMHMKGTPATMKGEAVYQDLTREVLDFFIRRLDECRSAGIRDVILDPGLGFAKKAAHNFELIRNLATFKMLGRPILLGLSRKSFIYTSLGISADEALNGTTVLNTLGLLNGAGILRVHDPAAAREAIRLVEGYRPD
jgi:dihydropteroate synthase